MNIWPHVPIPLISFLKEELKMGNKYVVGIYGSDAESLHTTLSKQIHLACLIGCTDPITTAKQGFVLKENQDPIDNDALDAFIFLGEQFLSSVRENQVQSELSRILRLNSYVIGIQHCIQNDKERTFGWALYELLQQYTTVHEHEFFGKLNNTELENFFPTDYQQHIFSNQLRLTDYELEIFIWSLIRKLNIEELRISYLMKGVKILFEQYKNEERVIIDFQSILHYGLYNTYVPAISLRKNLFFILLRPFALGFYILVKFNIYFWKIMARIFQKK